MIETPVVDERLQVSQEDELAVVFQEFEVVSPVTLNSVFILSYF